MKHSLHFVCRRCSVVLLLAAWGLWMGGCDPDYGTDIPHPTVLPPRFTPRTSVPVIDHDDVPAGSHPWLPPNNREDFRRWRGIVVHHSALDTGNAQTIDRLHKNRGFDGLGYHFVIGNGRGGTDGKVEVGYRWRRQEKGAHCRVNRNDANYWNEHTIGICLVGNFENYRPTRAQYDSLAKLIRFLQNRYRIPTSKIKGHSDIKATKCPGKHFSFWELKRKL